MPVVVEQQLDYMHSTLRLLKLQCACVHGPVHGCTGCGKNSFAMKREDAEMTGLQAARKKGRRAATWLMGMTHSRLQAAPQDDPAPLSVLLEFAPQQMAPHELPSDSPYKT